MLGRGGGYRYKGSRRFVRRKLLPGHGGVGGFGLGRVFGGVFGFPVSLQSGRGQDNFMFAGPGQESSRSPDGIARGF